MGLSFGLQGKGEEVGLELLGSSSELRGKLGVVSAPMGGLGELGWISTAEGGRPDQVGAVRTALRMAERKNPLQSSKRM